MKPEPTPQTQPFWDAAAAGELQIQRCLSCERHYFYPRPFCRYCASEQVEWVRVSGRGRLLSYVINHKPLPGFEAVSPVIALVELDEGPRLMTNIVGVEPDPEALILDMPVVVEFEQRFGVSLPVFRPVQVTS